jgi:hypothetical protein
VEGFGVVANALIDASDGVTGITEQIKGCKISDLGPNNEHTGHDGLNGAIGEFTSRWQIGVGHLLDDGQEFATRLRDTASAYIGMDEQVASVMRNLAG